MDTIGGGEVSLGDLADLTVTNDNDLSCDVSPWGAPPLSGPPRHPAQCWDWLSSGRVPACTQPLTQQDDVRSFASSRCVTGMLMQAGAGTGRGH